MKIKNKNIIYTIVFCLLFIAILKVKDISVNDEQIYLIKKGATINSLATDLKNNNLINSKLYFKILAKLTNTDKKIQAGYYKIDNSTSIYDFLKKISNGEIIIKNITLVEGHTIEQYYQQLNNNPAILVNKTLDDITSELRINPPYEGWFFPDTYQIKYADNITSIFNKAHKKMQNNLEYLWQNRAKDLPFKSRYEAIILASLIEKETAYNKEKSKISAVFLNRIKKNMRLQSDPSVIYALGDNYNNSLSKQNLMFKSPYNTYLNNGLPIGAISSVGYQSLYAAFNPEKNNNLYFVSKKDGSHAFANNYNEHKKNIARYLKN